ncbi:pyroglutamyl-peptidase I [Limnohabitans sp. T6-5]|uniref:pyroglutamyl-peptidase I n=1 Tax=Limnohabitans sp. T6-5 TaxID=1100724 RepID=UPI000D35613B|nr:pyroglutamyl-peptidase I [Limnohabitans sp. T6-5]PUE05863.1 pyroglutamyl-peptidase I [Limnohabitans sp. T6-5]
MSRDATVRILLTGFEPFGGQSVNPSWEVARALQGADILGARVSAVQLPCVFAQAATTLNVALSDLRPHIVLALGQAEGRSDLSVERVAINVMDARIADNAGDQPIDVPVVSGAPVAYFSTLPIKTLVAGLKAAGFPSSVSQTAGTFVCNQVFYALQHALDGRGVCSGFMHLPLLPIQAATWPGPAMPSMALEVQQAGVSHALTLLVKAQQQGLGDLHISGGTLN